MNNNTKIIIETGVVIAGIFGLFYFLKETGVISPSDSVGSGGGVGSDDSSSDDKSNIYNIYVTEATSSEEDLLTNLPQNAGSPIDSSSKYSELQSASGQTLYNIKEPIVLSDSLASTIKLSNPADVVVGNDLGDRTVYYTSIDNISYTGNNSSGGNSGSNIISNVATKSQPYETPSYANGGLSFSGSSNKNTLNISAFKETGIQGSIGVAPKVNTTSKVTAKIGSKIKSLFSN